jgi:hypothetical protein
MSVEFSEVTNGQEMQSKGAYASTIFSAQANFLKGEVLTIIDAAILDERQCKAVKDLIHSAFKDKMDDVSRRFGGNSHVVQCADGVTTTGARSTP